MVTVTQKELIQDRNDAKATDNTLNLFARVTHTISTDHGQLLKMLNHILGQGMEAARTARLPGIKTVQGGVSLKE